MKKSSCVLKILVHGEDKIECKIFNTRYDDCMDRMFGGFPIFRVITFDRYDYRGITVRRQIGLKHGAEKRHGICVKKIYSNSSGCKYCDIELGMKNDQVSHNINNHYRMNCECV